MLYRKKGFTLVELMITLIIAAIILVLAVPSFRYILERQQIDSNTNDLMTALTYARSEAIKRGVSVSVCPASNSTQNDCGDADDWGNGWIVFVDSDADGDLEDTADRLWVSNALSQGSVLTTTEPYVTYLAAGFVSEGAGDYLIKTEGCEGQGAKLLSVSSNGRVEVSTTSCG